MKRLIVIHGPMCAGKTTIVSELRKALPQALCFDRPTIKDDMLYALKKQDEKRASKIANEAVFFLCQKTMIGGQDIILQEFRRKYIQEHLEEEIEKYSYKVISFYLDISLDIALKRAAQRGRDSPESVKKNHAFHARVDAHDNIINTNKPIEEIVQEMLLAL